MASERERFWQNVLLEAELEPRENVRLEGGLGIVHEFPVAAYSADDKRIALVVSQPDPVKAKLIERDIASRMGGTSVSVVRPILADTRELINKAVSALFVRIARGEDIKSVLQNEINSFNEDVRTTAPEGDPSKLPPHELVTLLEATIFSDVIRAIRYSREVTGIYFFENAAQIVREILTYDLPTIFAGDQLNLGRLISHEPNTREIVNGICSLPLYELSESDWKTLTGSGDEEGAKNIVRNIGFTQFFRPPVDHSALALSSRGRLLKKDLGRAIELIEEGGHPRAAPELLGAVRNVEDLIQKLEEIKYIISGSAEIELTENGRRERLSVEFRPREAMFFKLLQQVPYLKDLISTFRG